MFEFESKVKFEMCFGSMKLLNKVLFLFEWIYGDDRYDTFIETTAQIRPYPNDTKITNQKTPLTIF